MLKAFKRSAQPADETGQMRTFAVALFALGLLGLTHAAAGSSAPPSAEIQAKNAQAAQVLAQVNQLDTRFGALVDAWDGAKVQLAATEQQLAAHRAELSIAQKQSLIAQRHAAQLLVTIYEGQSPDLIQLLVGSSKLSDVINAVQYTRDVASSAQHVAAAAVRARDRLTAATARLQRSERTRRATLAQLDSERATIGAMLTKRRALLSSIQSEIVQMKAREAAQQARAAAAARARLARQEAQLREEAAQRVKEAEAAAAAAQPAPKPTPTANTTPSTPTAPAETTAPAATTTTGVTTSVTTSDAAPPTPPAAAPVSGGHPQAASIALQYLGIKYQWGGASPGTGFDCSGLVMYVFAQLGVQLPHFAAGQYGYGTAVPRDQLQPGDLVFFDGLSHVGIYIGNGQMVHAPQTGDVVKISPLSEFGGARYVGARRV
jgi:peptidoglycan DL-endopeptidase CwlO